MPQFWSSQSNDDPEDIDAWMVRRNSQLAVRSEADALARNLWNKSIESGEDVYAGNPSDLTAIGLAALGQPDSYPPSAANDDEQAGSNSPPNPSLATDGELPRYRTEILGGARQGGPPLVGAAPDSLRGSQPQRGQGLGSSASLPSDTIAPSVSELEVIGPRPPLPPHPGFLDGVNHSLAARALAGGVGYAVGLPAGALRAGWHALEGVGHGLNFAGSLFFPEGRAAAWNDATAATQDALQYGRSVIANPSRLADDALSEAKAANRSLNPLATPIPDTASGAFGHELGIGANAGETLTNILGVVAAPEVVGGINAARAFAATREANIAEMMGRGIDEPTARYLSKPYEGRGDHALIQNSQKSVLGFGTPLLRKAPIPKWIMDSPLNVSRPRGLSQYDFYKYHYAVDPQFYGGSLPRHLRGGKGFSGADLGFERYSNPGRTWARIPSIWKDYYTGATSGDAIGRPPQDPTEAPQ